MATPRRTRHGSMPTVALRMAQILPRLAEQLCTAWLADTRAHPVFAVA
jgi:hypothetical protein